MADLQARLEEINDMVEDLVTEREAIINLMKVIQKGQPVRERAVSVPEPAPPPTDEAASLFDDTLPTPKEAISLMVSSWPGRFTRKSLVDHLEDRVASESENVRNVLYTQLRRDEVAGRVWEDEDEFLYHESHPKAAAASRNGDGSHTDDNDDTPASAETDTGARD